MPSSSSTKRAIGGHVAHGALHGLADRVLVLHLVPRVALELADAERDLLLVFVYAEHDRFDFLALGQHVTRTGDALGPRELGDVNETFDALFEFDECAVRHEVRDLAFDLSRQRRNAPRSCPRDSSGSA
jgi:hypothetical protein